MPYQPFIIALIAAFILSVQTIAAQTHKSALDTKEFNQLLYEDDPELYTLAKGKKLSLSQLETFLATQIYYGAEQEIIDTLGRAYWEELGHKERLIYTNICMLDKYVFINEEINETFVFSETFAYVIKHRKDYEKAWGKDLLQSFIYKKLKVEPDMIGLIVAADEELTIAKQIAIIDTYAKTIKRVLPEYEDFARYYAYAHLIYNYEQEQPKEYYKCLNEYLYRFETNENILFQEIMQVIKQHKEAYYLKFALNWGEKLLKIRDDAQYKQLKAVLLYRLGEKELARTLFLRAAMELDDTNPFWKRGIPDFYEEIFLDME